MIRGIQLSVFAYRRLKIIGEARNRILVEIGVLARRVRASMIHVIAQPVCPAAQRHHCHRLDAFGGNKRTMRIRHLDARAQFRIGVRIAGGVIRDSSFGRRLRMAIAKEKLRRRCLLMVRIKYLGSERVACLCWEKAILWNRRASPGGTQVDGSIQASFDSELFQKLEVFDSLRSRGNKFAALPVRDLPGGAGVHILIFNLHANYRPTIFEEQAAHLFANFSKEAPGVREILLIGGTDRDASPIQPVGETAIATFSMRERADPEHDRQLERVAYLYKSAQITLARPVEHPFLLFHVNPEYIGGDNRNSPGLHLAQLLLPTGARSARIVKLAHNWHTGTTVMKQIVVCKGECLSLGIGSSQLELARENGLSRLS